MEYVPKTKPRGRPRKGPNNSSMWEDKEFLNEYHRNYYHSNNLSDKVVCPLCLRIVSKQKLDRHQKTPICKRHMERRNENSDDICMKQLNYSEMPNDDDDDGDLEAQALLQKAYGATPIDTLVT